MQLLNLAILVIFIVIAQSNIITVNTVGDVHRQANQLHRCWEPIDLNDFSLGHRLSEPMYKFCHYILDSGDRYFVTGVDPTAEDLSKIEALFDTAEDKLALTNVCIQENFSFEGPHKPSQSDFRCMCNRDACNVPEVFSKYLEHNRRPIQFTE